MMSLTYDEGIGRITQLYMHPDAVGHGVGTLMIKKAKSILGSPIQLYTFQENDGAIRFYERHGFQAIGFDDGLVMKKIVLQYYMNGGHSRSFDRDFASRRLYRG